MVFPKEKTAWPYIMSERFTTQEKPRQAYTTRLEIEEYQSLSALEGEIPPQEYAQLLLSWKQEKVFNQQTNLGERFNAQLFEVDYPLENGRLKNPFRNENMLESIVTGQQKRLDKSLSHDDKREIAEVVTFSAVESYFAQNSGTLVVPSPAGGSFGNNYVDVYTSREEDGKKLVRLQRFPTDLSLGQHWEAAQALTREALGKQSDKEKDIQIKTLVLETKLTVDQLRNIYTPGRNTTSTQKYQELKNACGPLINYYIDSILDGAPENTVATNHNSILKFADICMGKDTDSIGQITPRHIFNETNVAYAAAALGKQDTRPVMTGCGLQGSTTGNPKRMDLVASLLFSGPQNNLFSTGEEDKSDFPCPKCGHIIIYGSGTKQCPGCGLEATCG